MRIKKSLSNNQRKRTLHRNKIRLVNRRQSQFAIEQFSNEQSMESFANELDNN